MRNQFPFLLLSASLPCLLFFAGCEDKELTDKVNKLESELAETKLASKDELDSAIAKAEDLARRLEAIEQKSNDAVSQVTSAATISEERFQRLEKSLAELVQYQEKREKTAFLSPNVTTPTAVQTEFGVFLLKLDKLGWDSETSKYVAQINMGNLVGLTIAEFVVKGDFGGNAPKLIAGEDYAEYNKRMQTWEASLTPFEHTVLQRIDPEGWTSFELPLNANSEKDLDLIRITLSIKRAGLEQGGPTAGNDKMTLLSVGGGGNTIGTRHGEFLIKLLATEPEGSSTRVYFQIGNPLGFIAAQSRMKGKYGLRAPEKLPGESNEMFGQRQKQWMSELKDFDAVVVDPIKPTVWSRVSILIPEPDHNKVQAILTNLQFEKLNLPIAPN